MVVNQIDSVNDLLAMRESVIKSQKPPDSSVHKKVVCKFWLNGECKRGSNCPYLHFYDRDKAPICNTFAKDGICPRGDSCDFRHENHLNDRRQEECPYFELGFCKLG